MPYKFGMNLSFFHPWAEKSEFQSPATLQRLEFGFCSFTDFKLSYINRIANNHLIYLMQRKMQDDNRL